MSLLAAGDPAPWFMADSTSSPNFHFETVGGYRIILSFLGSSTIDRSKEVLQQFMALQDSLEQQQIIFFGVLIDPGDLALKDWIELPTFFKLFWDFDQKISALYGTCESLPDDPDSIRYAPTTFVLNQNLQIAGIFPLQAADQHVAQVLTFTQNLPIFPPPQLAARQAPVLVIPNVFDRSFCQHLINLYDADGGRASGFMREVEGKTVAIMEDSFKRRRDWDILEPNLLQQVNDRVLRRVKPEVEKAFQFSITRFERHLVGCYEDHNQGFFRRHRDNTTKGTAHRRFAMTLNLNTGAYEGGCLWFPEYGSQLYRPEVGEAVVFSCSLLHEVTPIRQGRRLAMLSFFYGDEEAQLRAQNRKYLDLGGNKEVGAIASASSQTSESS
ncbi:MAG: 2OG-Fe(II) oxygenase [Oscillatoriophycideae cyanobacterium NC_groundwater_1537_Pr4_S-0.65um_50_18]|nr:2OG-Fe(II) oxygenase [Oscillatoriophycideae cyanobacterium NC_groundwater_1537_Pr4_S-0.65um_50_18]